MRLQLCKPTGPDARLIPQNARNSDLGIVVKNGLRNATKEGKGRHMTIAKRFRRLGRVALHEHCIRMRQAHHKEMDFAFHATNYTKGLSKIHLCMAWPMRQRHKHLFGATLLLTHVIRHRREAACIVMFITQALKDALRRVTLLFDQGFVCA